MPYAYRRAFPAITRIKTFEAEKDVILPANLLLEWLILIAHVRCTSAGSYNDRFMALGGGGFAGSLKPPTNAVKDGYAGAFTDTGPSMPCTLQSGHTIAVLLPPRPRVPRIRRGCQQNLTWHES